MLAHEIRFNSVAWCGCLPVNVKTKTKLITGHKRLCVFVCRREEGLESKTSSEKDPIQSQE